MGTILQMANEWGYTEIETEGVANQGMTTEICEEEVHEALGGTKWGKTIGADKIPVEAWKCTVAYPGGFWLPGNAPPPQPRFFF